MAFKTRRVELNINSPSIFLLSLMFTLKGLKNSYSPQWRENHWRLNAVNIILEPSSVSFSMFCCVYPLGYNVTCDVISLHIELNSSCAFSFDLYHISIRICFVSNYFRTKRIIHRSKKTRVVILSMSFIRGRVLMTKYTHGAH